jgi:hypothetical protein
VASEKQESIKDRLLLYLKVTRVMAKGVVF